MLFKKTASSENKKKKKKRQHHLFCGEIDIIYSLPPWYYFISLQSLNIVIWESINV